MDFAVWSPVIAFGGVLSRYSVFVHISDKRNPPILKLYSTILTVTHMLKLCKTSFCSGAEIAFSYVLGVGVWTVTWGI